jgi:flagellar basal-body rod protein FlgF
MNNALYVAYQGMKARQRALDALANNIANASTTGFKSDQLFHKSLEAAEVQTMREEDAAKDPVSALNLNTGLAQVLPDRDQDPKHGIALGITTGSMSDFSAGSIRQTGNPLDVALNGEGFLVVQTPAGERYTRAGSLKIDAAGQLTTNRGDLVVGKGGPITVPKGNISIGDDGSISVGEQVVGQLKVVSFESPAKVLRKEGDSLFMAAEGVQPKEDTSTTVIQGSLEGSNVNVMGEMAQMMKTTHQFESLQKSITLMMNDLGRKVSQEIGRLS